MGGSMMSKYQVEGGKIVDTDRASGNWGEDTYFDGRNLISKATGSQWDHESLYQSEKGNFYVEKLSQWQGNVPSARMLAPMEAVAWLALNGHEIPEVLEEAAKQIIE
jgi:hypothetical protein